MTRGFYWILNSFTKYSINSPCPHSLKDKAFCSNPCYYTGMPYKYKEDQYKAMNRHRQMNRVYLVEYLLNHPCACGESDVRVLEFHHVDPDEKSYDIARAVSGSTRSWKTILKEIEKCIVLCSNCHQKETVGEPLWFTDIEKYKSQIMPL